MMSLLFDDTTSPHKDHETLDERFTFAAWRLETAARAAKPHLRVVGEDCDCFASPPLVILSETKDLLETL